MKHPAPDRLVDLVEGRQEDALAVGHLRTCETCRREVERLASVLDAARCEDMPDFSPAFWEQFPRRVREALEAGDSRRRRWPAAWWWPAAAAASAALVLAVIVGVWTWDGAHGPQSQAPAVPPDVQAVASGESAGAGEAADADAAAWEQLAAAATGVDWETWNTAEAPWRAGLADRAVVELSDDERAELVRLLEQAIDRGGGPPS